MRLIGDDLQDKEPSYPPTVSKEKWLSHIVTKLGRGYVLIMNAEKRNANFFKPGKGYESCAYNAARQLLTMGLLAKAYDHYLGPAYMLAAPLPPSAAPSPPPPEDEDPMDTLLDELAESADDKDDDDLDD